VNTVELPVPPSVNDIWRVAKVRSGARVTLSKTYRAWRDEAVLLCRMGLATATEYPVCVRVEIVRGKGWRAGRDADNVLKGILDSLVKSGRLADDSEDHVGRVVVEFGERRDTACVRVTVEPIRAG
jgi:Holliday junction resolvase RusA-like endonuclease